MGLQKSGLFQVHQEPCGKIYLRGWISSISVHGIRFIWVVTEEICLGKIFSEADLTYKQSTLSYYRKNKAADMHQSMPIQNINILHISIHGHQHITYSHPHPHPHSLNIHIDRKLVLLIKLIIHIVIRTCKQNTYRHTQFLIILIHSPPLAHMG